MFYYNIKGYIFPVFKSMGLESFNQFFRFSIESLTLTKIDRLPVIQHKKIIKTYYKNGDSATATHRGLRFT